MGKHNRYLKNGFTLIEILISFGIFAILMGIVLSGFMDTRKLERLRQSALELVSTLQKAQNYALTGYAVSGIVPVGGYGVHFNLDLVNPANTEYFIFADTYSVNSTTNLCDDTQGNQRYDNLLSNPICGENPLGSGIFLHEGVIVHKILVNTNQAIAGSIFDVSFKSPMRMPYTGTGDAAAMRYPGVASAKSVDIFLKLKDKNICRKVNVKKNTGQINEQAVSWTVCQ
ncbi:MAG: prepilin-type N-terminal cleavage/methylation domain-containing protein [Patescibacteria group bacterium]